MVLQAQSGIVADSTDLVPTQSPLVPASPMSEYEIASALAISKGQVS